MARKLTDEIVFRIHERTAEGASREALARELGLSKGSIANALKLKPRKRRRPRATAAAAPPASPELEAATSPAEAATPANAEQLRVELDNLKREFRRDLKATTDPTIRARISRLLVMLLQIEKQLLPKEDEKDVITVRASDLEGAAARVRERLHKYVEEVAARTRTSDA